MASLNECLACFKTSSYEIVYSNNKKLIINAYSIFFLFLAGYLVELFRGYLFLCRVTLLFSFICRLLSVSAHRVNTPRTMSNFLGKTCCSTLTDVFFSRAFFCYRCGRVKKCDALKKGARPRKACWSSSGSLCRKGYGLALSTCCRLQVNSCCICFQHCSSDFCVHARIHAHTRTHTNMHACRHKYTDARTHVSTCVNWLLRWAVYSLKACTSHRCVFVCMCVRVCTFLLIVNIRLMFDGLDMHLAVWQCARSYAHTQLNVQVDGLYSLAHVTRWGTHLPAWYSDGLSLSQRRGLICLWCADSSLL